VGGFQAATHPDLVVALSRNVKSRRHDTDDRARFTIEHKAAANRVSALAPELPLATDHAR
jgi:hypothetical protein